MYKLEVGKPFKEGIRYWPESTLAEYRKDGLWVMLFFNGITKKEMKSFIKGDVQLALYQSGPIIFILANITGCLSWSDIPYTIHMVKDKVKPDILSKISFEEGQGIPVYLVLVEGNSGIVKAMRMIGAETEFSNTLVDLTRRQALSLFNQKEYDNHLRYIQQEKSAEDMLEEAKGRFLHNGKGYKSQ